MSDMSPSSAKRVTGIGGIFFKARDAEALRDWYRKHLGLDLQSWGGTTFQWHSPEAPTPNGATLLTIFDGDSKYFAPSASHRTGRASGWAREPQRHAGLEHAVGLGQQRLGWSWACSRMNAMARSTRA